MKDDIKIIYNGMLIALGFSFTTNILEGIKIIITSILK